jgi:prefoldin subunit 5
MESSDLKQYAESVFGKNLTLNLQNEKWYEDKIEEYKTVAKEVIKLGEKSSHRLMVPIAGKTAFFPNGKIKHSNEFLVSIGDNYFL